MLLRRWFSDNEPHGGRTHQNGQRQRGQQQGSRAVPLVGFVFDSSGYPLIEALAHVLYGLHDLSFHAVVVRAVEPLDRVRLLFGRRPQLAGRRLHGFGFDDGQIIGSALGPI